AASAATGPIPRPVVGVVLEAGGAGIPREMDDSGGAVALLGDDQLGDVDLVGVLLGPAGVVGVVVVLAVEEHDHVGVLLDGARFAQVAHPRPVALALLAGAVEL